VFKQFPSIIILQSTKRALVYVYVSSSIAVKSMFRVTLLSFAAVGSPSPLQVTEVFMESKIGKNGSEAGRLPRLSELINSNNGLLPAWYLSIYGVRSSHKFSVGPMDSRIVPNTLDPHTTCPDPSSERCGGAI
jgi:hypothetical protein